jgi:hypothetical protein
MGQARTENMTSGDGAWTNAESRYTNGDNEPPTGESAKAIAGPIRHPGYASSVIGPLIATTLRVWLKLNRCALIRGRARRPEAVAERGVEARLREERRRRRAVFSAHRREGSGSRHRSRGLQDRQRRRRPRATTDASVSMSEMESRYIAELLDGLTRATIALTFDSAL